jgi:hypothetical protein
MYIFKIGVCITLITHYVFTIASYSEHGYAGFFPPFEQSNTTQIFSDLVIGLSLVNIWVFYDLRRRGKSMLWFVLHLAGTALAGSFVPLVYFLLRPATEAVVPADAV